MISSSYARKVFFHSLRTAIIFVAGLIVYEILVDLEKVWNIANPGNKIFNFTKRNILKFIFIFLIDLVVLCVFYWIFDTKV
jgi:hypothetical protein